MTTKFYLCSDFHLEGGTQFIFQNTDNVDCLLLAGDIVEFDKLKVDGTAPKNVLDFFSSASAQFKNVIWIPGNHEFWGSWSMSYGFLKATKFLTAAGFHNVKLLQNKKIQVNDVTILASTLWTDINRGNPVDIMAVGQIMNDYRYIRTNDHKLRPTDTIKEHKISVCFLKNELDSVSPDEKIVILTHHQPIMVSSEYTTDGSADYAYCSDLSDIILDYPQIKYWCSGHTHIENRVITMGNNQKLITHCHGYNGSRNSPFKPFYFEVE